MMQIKDELIRNLLFWIQQKKWLIIIFISSLIIYNLPYPSDISKEGYRTLIICFIVISLIITEPIPLPAVALLIAILEVFFHIAPAAEVARTYMNDSVFFIMGSLMMAVAIIHQGLDKRLALGIIQVTGNKISRVILGFTCFSAILSSFIGEHTVVALMLPVGLSLIKNCGKSYPIPNITALILFSIAYGSTIGSIGTPSGGARNAIIIEYWKTITESGITLTYLQWIIMAYPMVLLGMLSTSIILQIVFKPEFNQLDTAIRRLKIQVAHQGKITINEFLTIFIFIFVLLCWIFLNEQYGLGIVAISGAFLYMATGLVEWKQVSQNTNWGVILLFAGVISLGVQMQNTGAAMWIGNTLINQFSSLIYQFDTFPYIFNILITTIMSNIMSSSGTVAVLAPITLNMGANTAYMGMVTAIASAFGYFSVVAAPACMIIYSSGLVKVTDFIKAGSRIVIVSTILLLLIYKFYWPLVIEFTNFK